LPLLRQAAERYQQFLSPLMFRLISIFGCLLVFTLFLSCKKQIVDSKHNYNQKANELIQQLLIKDSCPCILTFGNISLIELALEDAPSRDIRKQIIAYLDLRDRKELDSLESLSKNFILDTISLKSKNVKLIQSSEYYKETHKYPNRFDKIYPNGCLDILTPIFDKEYKKAVIYSYPMATIRTYKFENGIWKLNE
jgi:hypothetical protein